MQVDQQFLLYSDEACLVPPTMLHSKLIKLSFLLIKMLGLKFSRLSIWHRTNCGAHLHYCTFQEGQLRSHLSPWKTSGTDWYSAKVKGIGLLRAGVFSRSFFLINFFSDYLGCLGKNIVPRRKGKRYHLPCVIPTVNHPETIHVYVLLS